MHTPAEEYAQIAALATGDQRHIELAALGATVTRLERAERAHHAAIASQQRSITQAERTIGELHARIDAINALTPQLTSEPGVIQCIDLNTGKELWKERMQSHRSREHLEFARA